MANDRANPGDGPGKILNAASHNRQVEAAEQIAADRVGAKPPQKAPPVRTNWCIQQIRNDTGATRRQWEVVQVGGLILTTLDEYWPSFQGLAITDPNCNSFAILQQPLATTDIDPIARVAAWSTALVNVTQECHRRAEVVIGSHVLQSAASGGQFRIEYKPSGTGELTCTVLFERDEPITRMLRAYDCIQPGSTSATARVQRRGTSGWENDPAFPTAVCVDNSDCLVYAPPGELFQAQRTNCCSGCWLPTAEHGLMRRVKIDTCIPCGESGDATVLMSLCGGGSGSGGDCGKTNSSCGTIRVCNNTGRPLSPGGVKEEATAWLTPGVKAANTDCCWSIIPNYFPQRATGTLTAKLCPSGTAALRDVTFPAYCGDVWDPSTITSGTNPYLAACSGSQVDLAPKFKDCTLTWEVVQVAHKFLDAIAKTVTVVCSGSSCSLQPAQYQQVGVVSCDDTVCSGQPAAGTGQTGSLITVTTSTLDLSCSGSSGLPSVSKSSVTFCAFCAGAPVDGGTETFGTPVTLSQGVYAAGGCLSQTQIGAVVLCAGTPSNGAVPGVECSEDCPPGSGS